jgi:hypothetical protein
VPKKLIAVQIAAQALSLARSEQAARDEIDADIEIGMLLSLSLSLSLSL